MKKVLGAKLEGWAGPYYPPLARVLTRLYAEIDKRWDGEFLERIGRGVIGYAGKDFGIKTSDGYSWFWGLTFRANGRGHKCHVMILFPQSSQKIGDKKSVPNRSIAIYKDGHPTRKSIERILSAMIETAREETPHKART